MNSKPFHYANQNGKLTTDMFFIPKPKTAGINVSKKAGYMIVFYKINLKKNLYRIRCVKIKIKIKFILK